MKVMELFVWGVLGALAAVVPASTAVLPTARRPQANDNRLAYTPPEIVYEGRINGRGRQ